MQRADLVIGVLAVLALAGSVVGVVTYEPEALSNWDVTVSTEERTDIEVLVMDTPPRAASGNWEVLDLNLTTVEFSIAVSSTTQARTQAVLVRVTATPPDANFTESQEVTLPSPSGTTATGTFTVDLDDAPTAGTVQAADAAAAVATVPTSTNGTGNWTITAEIVSGGAGVPPVVPAEAIRVVVTVDRVAFYRASAAPATPDLGGAAQ